MHLNALRWEYLYFKFWIQVFVVLRLLSKEYEAYNSSLLHAYTHDNMLCLFELNLMRGIKHTCSLDILSTQAFTAHALLAHHHVTSLLIGWLACPRVAETVSTHFQDIISLVTVQAHIWIHIQCLNYTKHEKLKKGLSHQSRVAQWPPPFFSISSALPMGDPEGYKQGIGERGNLSLFCIA